MVLFYTFEANCQHVGFSYLKLTTTRLLSVTRFRQPDGELYTNRFDLRLDADGICAIKHDDQAWVDLSELPENHYPSAAYPLLLARVRKGSYSYTQVSDSDEAILGEIRMVREGDDIVEYDGVVMRRRFTMDGERPVYIDWRGACSNLVEDATSAVGDSGVPLEKNDLG